MSPELTDQDLQRYSRQILLAGFDIAGQQCLQRSRALILGAGGLGCACTQYLVAAGLGELVLIDDDRVDLSNLPRQILYSQADIGRPKVDSAADALRGLNSDCVIHPLNLRLDEHVSARADFLAGVDILIDCSDNLEARNHLNRLSRQLLKPLVSGAAIRMEGQVACFDPRQPKSPCYACLSALFAEQQLGCAEAGVLAPLVGVIGSMQALTAIKLLTAFGDSAPGLLQVYDGLAASWQQFRIPRREECPVCGEMS